MAKLVYITSTSLDLYVEDATGGFDWLKADQVHAPILEVFRSIGTCLYGRRLYQTMTDWNEPVDRYPSEYRDFARSWQQTEKIVFSRTLTAATTPNTRIEPEFDLEAIRTLKRHAQHDISIGGADLASVAFEGDLVDECHLFVHPVIVGGGKPAFKVGVRRNLELLETRDFSSGIVHLRYRVINERARALGEALATEVAFRGKVHFDESCPLLIDTLALSPWSESVDLLAELESLSAFIATYAVDVELAVDPDYKSEVLREFYAHYLSSCQNDEERSEANRPFAQYEAALRSRSAHEREDDLLARVFAERCERTEYEFCSVASDIILQELILMRGVIRPS